CASARSPRPKSTRRMTAHGGKGGEMGNRTTARTVLAALALGPLFAAPTPVAAQQTHRNGFETRQTAWVKGPSDASYKETSHEVTDQTSPHTGQLCEHIQLVAEKGNFIQYHYPVPRAPVCD